MTRRSKRYERRSIRREERRLKHREQYDCFDFMASRNALFEAGDLAKKGVMWKSSIQNWSIHQLLSTEKLYRALQNGEDVRRGFSRFYIYERGKKRNISAVHFFERVAQKSLCKNILYPAFNRGLIHDNSASRKGKGTKFASDRVVRFLCRHFRRHGNTGYVLCMDFKGYFDNINHDVVKRICRRHISDVRILKYVDDFVDAYGEIGLGLGSETSQAHAIRYPNRIDHFITERNFGSKVYYGRYMDDSYVISGSKEALIKILFHLKRLCSELKINLSARKTRIVKVKNGFTFLKTKFYLSDTGRVIRKPCRSCVVRERRKLKRQLRLCELGTMNMEQIERSFESWAGSMKRRDARLTVFNMRRLLKKGQKS